MSLIDGIYQEQEAQKAERRHKEMMSVKSKHSLYLQNKTSEILRVLSDRYISEDEGYSYLIKQLQEIQDSAKL